MSKQHLTPARATHEAVVETLLEGDTPIRLWHCACHGDFENEAPAKSPLLLEGRQPFTPDDIVGQAQTRLKTDRPLVFLNACRVGQSGLALTGMGGWAKVMVQDCGVGAFIAPMWEVDDVQARRFAATMYDFLRRTPGGTLAQALRHYGRLAWPCASCRSTIPPGWLTACTLTPTSVYLWTAAQATGRTTVNESRRARSETGPSD